MPPKRQRLWGAAEALREAIGAPLPPADRVMPLEKIISFAFEDKATWDE